jgi:cytochrome c553
MPHTPYFALLPLSITALSALSGHAADGKLSFNRDVQPILAEYCYHCHGPDSGTRKPTNNPLRLDIEEFAHAVRDGGPQAIIPGNGAGSEVIKRMRSKDPLEVMPPPEMHHILTEQQISTIERWIDEGAKYEPHWSFVKPTRPEVPKVDGSWGKNPIDAFLHQEMTRRGLSPNPPEDPARLFRRATLDLTGLPPAPSDVRAFLEDSSPDAYERAIDRMFAAPAHAEQMARHWLDAARYADTHGIHIDNYRAIWPYRDWVVAAFKQNMPFDQFSIEQLAGDMLPEPTLDQKVATGFNRCLPTTGEGGAINEEYEAIYQMDRVETTAGVWMGLTMACAACHDHKFDPITAEDYFAFAAFFRNTTMQAMDRNAADHPPNVFVPMAEDRPRFGAIDGLIRKVDEDLAARAKAAETDVAAWIASLGNGGGLEVPKDGLVWTAADSTEPVKLPGGEGIVVEGAEVATAVDGSKSFGFGIMVKIDGAPNGALVARMDPANGHRGWDLWLQDGHLAAHFIHQFPDKTLKVVTKEKLKPGVWTHVWVNYDAGKRPNDRATLFIDGKPAAQNVESRTIAGSIATDVPLRLGARQPGEPGPQAIPAGAAEVRAFRFYQRAPDAGEVGLIALKDGTGDGRGALAREHYLANLDEASKALRAQRETLQKEMEDIRKRGSVSLVMQEKPNSEPSTHFLERGNYQSPKHPVKANIPASLPPLPEGTRADRLAMAKWLFDPEHPLTARVAVNRMWAQVFGDGLVATTGDFGLMGERPSHPDLLDWLAVEFRESGWDQRHMMRLMLTSQAYRQSAVRTEEKADADAENRLLARGPRLRLDAEVLRDMALSASGLLVDRTGGPPVKPYQPDGVWEAVAMHQSNTRNYKQDQGDALYRRSLYTLWKRTAPHPAMEIFNAPSREKFCTKRERTNTPLQALVLMNDPQFVEACRVLAESVLTQHTTTTARLEEIMMRLLARGPTASETDILTRSLADFLDVFQGDAESAKLLLDVGEAPQKPGLDPAETAAWTLVASQILNTDECVTR